MLLERIDNAVELDRVHLVPAGEVTVLNVHYQITQKPTPARRSPPKAMTYGVHDLYDVLLVAGLAERTASLPRGRLR